MADYIVNKGLENPALRDEIYCQLANQTWKNTNPENEERGWLLMAHCLSAFPPGKNLHKYLLKHASDHASEGYRGLCQRKLIRAGKIEPVNSARKFPPTLLEYKANRKQAGTALEGVFHDSVSSAAQVGSFTTAEQLAADLLADRGVPELTGWTVCLEQGDSNTELNGGDFVLDAISQMELAPGFPGGSDRTFLVTSDRSRGQLPLLINTGPHNNPASKQYRFGCSPTDLAAGSALRAQRARSQDRLLTSGDDLGLSKSALNERYFDEKIEPKSRSLDNLLDGSQGE